MLSTRYVKFLLIFVTTSPLHATASLGQTLNNLTSIILPILSVIAISKTDIAWFTLVPRKANPLSYSHTRPMIL